MEQMQQLDVKMKEMGESIHQLEDKEPRYSRSRSSHVRSNSKSDKMSNGMSKSMGDSAKSMSGKKSSKKSSIAKQII